MAQLVAFLNELSPASAVLSLPEAQQLVRLSIDAIRAARAYKGATSINAVCPIADHMVDADKTVRQVLRGDDFREEWGFLRRLQDRSPIDPGLAHLDELDSVEYLCDGNPAIALGWSDLLDTVVISFPSQEKWRRHEVQLERNELLPTGEIAVAKVLARNIGVRANADSWREWLSTYGSESIPSATECWESRVERFQGLRLLGRVEKDLLRLRDSGAAYRLAFRALETLNRDLLGWDGASEVQFSTRVTPEGATRKRLCLARDVDGKSYYFDLHARFTGGLPGRIHFRLSHEEKVAVVAYVGAKLDSPFA